jgi:hypothetical protein
MALTGYEKDNLEEYTNSELRQIASTYFITFKTSTGSTSTNYSRLNKTQLINEIKYDVDYQRANPDRKFDDITDQNDNRIIPIKRDLIGTESAEELMNRIINALSDTKVDYPEMGKYYTYIYNAKTPKLLFDLYPLIISSGPDGTGLAFIGFNYHWQLRGGQSPLRQYNFPEVQDGFYEMNSLEFITLRGINYAKFIINR